MEMKHGLPGAAAVVDDRTITVGQLALSGELCSHQLQAPEHCRVLSRGIGERNDVLPRTNQDVGRRLRMDVLKREDCLVLVHQLCGNFFSADLAEQAIFHNDPSASRVEIENPSISQADRWFDLAA